jgi:hypothetical protein
MNFHLVRDTILVAFIYTALVVNACHADELGFRFGSGINPTDSSIVSFPTATGSPGEGGKMIQLVYDWEPHQNFYLEGAFGYRSPSDILEYSSLAYEVSPGFRVTWGYLVLKLSEGVSYMPENTYNPVTQLGYQQFDFVTHLIIGLKDPKTGVGVYFDRSHYSNGSAVNNPSLNYDGFVILFKAPW